MLAMAHKLARAWQGLVQEYAEEARRDPAKLAERLERPPMRPDTYLNQAVGEYSNAKWHEADLAYRRSLEQLQEQVRRGNAGADAVWRGLFRIVYSPNTFVAFVWLVVVMWILNSCERTDAAQDTLVQLLKDFWLWLGGRQF